jgi:lipoate-protein ligase B
MLMEKQSTSKLLGENEPISEASLCRTYDLGTIKYEKALQLQNKLFSARIAGEIPDTILFLQHPSVLTIGASGNEKNIIVPRDLLARDGISICRIDRGGDITYHGPGQLVVYPIIDLRAKGIGPTQYVRYLEEVVIRALDSFYIKANRDPEYPGIWAGLDKICALGIRLIRWVTMHGFALNVSTDLKYFSYINPCGIVGRQVTSMSKLLGHDIALETVIHCITEQWAQIFNAKVREASARELYRYYVK